VSRDWRLRGTHSRELEVDCSEVLLGQRRDDGAARLAGDAKRSGARCTLQTVQTGTGDCAHQRCAGIAREGRLGRRAYETFVARPHWPAGTLPRGLIRVWLLPAAFGCESSGPVSSRIFFSSSYCCCSCRSRSLSILAVGDQILAPLQVGIFQERVRVIGFVQELVLWKQR